MTTPVGQIDVQNEFSERLTVHKNLGQDVIVVTMDKIRLCLMKHKDAISRRQEWVTPLGLLLSFLTTLIAADFKDFLISKDTWQALFILSSILCSVWLIYAANIAWKNRNAGDIENIVRELSAQNVPKDLET